MQYMSIRMLGKRNIASYNVQEFEKNIFPKLKKYGMSCSSIGSPIGKINVDDEVGHQKQLKELEELCKICVLINCKYIRVFSYFTQGKYEESYPKVLNKTRQLVQIASKYNIILLHENEKDIYGDSPERCMALYNDINCNSYKLIYDASNFIQCGYDALDSYEKVRNAVVYYHIKDCSSQKLEVPIGLGEGRYDKIIADLQAISYDGFCTQEPHIAWLSRNSNALKGIVSSENHKKQISNKSILKSDIISKMKIKGEINNIKLWKCNYDLFCDMIGK